MRWVVACLALCGCAYPEFQFARSDGAADSTESDAGIDGGTIVDQDSTPMVVDSTVDSTTDSTTDSTMMTTDTFVADTFTPDTSKPPDALVDAPISTGCTGLAVDFCADFDKSLKPEDDFTYPSVSPTGSLTLDTGGGRSSPTALLAATAPSTTGAPVVVANATKLLTAASLTTPMRIDLWLKLESATFPGDGAFLFKLQRGGGDGDGVTFSINPTGFYIDRIALTYEYYEIASPKPKPDVWTHVRIDLVLHATMGSITAWIDDMTTPVLSRTGISTVKLDSLERSFIVGLYAQKSTAPFRVRYDDVTFDFK